MVILGSIVCICIAQYLNCDSMSHDSTRPHSDCYKFYYCFNGFESILTCPEYYKFNETSGRCSYNPSCIQGIWPPISSENPCEKETGSNINKTHASSCKFYYACSAGLAVLQMCPDGWGFSDGDGKCVKGLNCI